MRKDKNILIRDIRINNRAFKYFEIIGDYHLGVERELLIPYVLMTYLIKKMESFKMNIDQEVLDYYEELKLKIKPKRKVKDAPVQGNFTKEEISDAMQERITEENELDLEKDFVEEKPKEGITDAR